MINARMETRRIKDVINDVFIEEFSSNPRRILLGEEIMDLLPRPRTPVLSADFRSRFADRIVDRIPLVEELLPGVGLGLAMGGHAPIIQFDWAAFIPLVLDQLYRLGHWRHRMARVDDYGVIIRMSDVSGGTGSPELVSSMLAHALHVPNLWVAIPSTPMHMKGIWRTAFKKNRPVLIIEPRREYDVTGPVPSGYFEVPFGASTYFRRGKDVTIIAWGTFGRIAANAARELEKEGIDAEVLVLQTLHPLDLKSLRESLKKTGRAVIAEEEMLRAGVGAEISATIMDVMPEVRTIRVAARNIPRPARKEWLHTVIPDERDIVRACVEIVRGD